MNKEDKDKDDNDIGFLYAIVMPNIRNRSVKIIMDNDPNPLFYKNDEFIEMVKGFPEISKILPALKDALSKTQNVVWKVKEELVMPLSYKSVPDSILRDLLTTKKESEDYVENLPIIEKFSRSHIDISDPDKPKLTLF